MTEVVSDIFAILTFTLMPALILAYCKLISLHNQATPSFDLMLTRLNSAPDYESYVNTLSAQTWFNLITLFISTALTFFLLALQIYLVYLFGYRFYRRIIVAISNAISDILCN